MNIEKNRAYFEELMAEVKRPGIENLMSYIRKSDFYTAPASTQFHLSCPGGLLQHSLNVYEALRAGLYQTTAQDGTQGGMYTCCRQTVAWIPRESQIVMALLHDICKTNFYGTELRNKKIDGKWRQVPVYIVDDRVPYGHGEKSVMMIEQFMRLKPGERYAIRWHMGFTEGADARTVGQAVERYPEVWALHDADMKASKFMEAKEANRPAFDREPALREEQQDRQPQQAPPAEESRQMTMEEYAVEQGATADAEDFYEAEAL